MKTLFVALIAWFGVCQAVVAESVDLDRLLQQIRQSQDASSAADAELDTQFLTNTNRRALLQEMLDQVEREKKKGQALAATVKANEERLAGLETRLEEGSADFGELFAVVRQVAADTKAALTDSLINAQYPHRIAPLDAIVGSDVLPGISQMESLWYVLQQDMTESGKVVRFPGEIDTAAGHHRKTDVVRIGPFVAVADGLYLDYLPETGALVEFARQPATRFLDLAENLEKAQSGLVKAAVDPTSGVILGMLGRAPTAIERIEQGGVIGYIILVLGAIGLVIVLVRIIGLSIVGRKVRGQLSDLAHPRTDNPLGRVLAAAKTKYYRDPETLQLVVDDAVVREVPALEKGQSLVKLLAAVAPLLGLLGTVTGMIETFQAISLFGTGDPKLMASGISQALMTTLLGLTVAIPLLFLHSLLSTRSGVLVQVLDEQSSGLIARVVENNGQ